ncbi:hypothetical protein JDV02_004515 [Purpureocillium takamizusanense]|uniref:N-acetyltransferase domain-containing protein n=1 Tax=Purpureocillium takamizusanense TaxID=2060973 RepID=A0A9Q8QFH2_9HYPO|nr:uncharacterized protein JDV02_004515 [Purpureocillium takamizusanense]UNI18236.1 hypothetical protein JDV02_004515 [Purpureocillium takamizusanense]
MTPRHPSGQLLGIEMAFDIVDPTPEQAPAVSTVHLQAMTNNALTQAQFPGEAAAKYFHRWLARNTLQHVRDANKGTLVARVSETGEVAGFIKWLVHEAGSNEAAAKDLESFSKPSNTELMDSYGELTERARREAMGAKPYYHVTFLCTDPKWAGCGIASALLGHVLERAEADGMSVILEATMEAVRLYQKFGFKIVREFHLKLPCRGSSDLSEPYEERCMVWSPSSTCNGV